MKLIQIKICTGTTCFVMGGSDLLTLEEHLSEEQKSQVNIEGANCLSWCKDPEKGKPPYVMINDKMIPEATIPKILNQINQIIND